MPDNRTIFVLGGTSDIGRFIVERYAAQGHNVVATYRSEDHVPYNHFSLLRWIKCDVSSPRSLMRACADFSDLGLAWDTFVSAVGSMEPIGRFMEVPSCEWSESVHVNAIDQLAMLRGLWPYRMREKKLNAAFFAGGGTNNPFTNYSAYAASKIFLIKMAELLDDEEPDLNCFVLGPGYVKTKIHKQTLSAGPNAGKNLGKTENLLRGLGTPLDDIFNCLEWCIGQGKAKVGGRNISVVHDSWSGKYSWLPSALERNNDLFKLRRCQ